MSFCLGFSGGTSGKELTCRGFDPWVLKVPLEEGMATDSSVLAWRIPWTEELGGLHPWGCKELDSTE